jgi:hypothetical protein
VPRRLVNSYQGFKKSQLLHLQGQRVQEEGLNLQMKAAHFFGAPVSTYLPIDTAVIAQGMVVQMKALCECNLEESIGSR